MDIRPLHSEADYDARHWPIDPPDPVERPSSSAWNRREWGIPAEVLIRPYDLNH